MIEAYKIGVSLLLDDSKLLGPLNDALKVLEKIQTAANEAKTAMDGMAAGLRGAVSASASVAANMERAAKAASASAMTLREPRTGFTMNGGGGDGRGAWNGLHIAGPDNRPTLNMPEVPPLPNSRGVDWDAAGGLMWKGMNALMIVNMITEGIGHLVDKARQLNDATVTLETRGLSASQAQDMQDLAIKIALGTPGRRTADVVTDSGNLRGILGEIPNVADPLAEVKTALPIVENLAAALAGKGMGGEEDIHRIMRAVSIMGGLTDENTGHIDPKRFTETLNTAYKMLTSGGGMFKPADLLNMSQQAAPIARLMGPDAFMHYMLTAGLDMKGNRAGTALTALGRQVFGGKGHSAMWKEWEKNDILPKGSVGEDGKLTDAAQDYLTNSTVGVEGGLFGWIKQVIQPKLSEHGFDTAEKLNKELYKMFGVETARRLAALWTGNSEQVTRDVALIDKTPGPLQDLEIEKAKSIGMNMGAFTTAFDNLLNSLEKANASPIISVLQGLTAAINALTAGSEAMQKLQSTNGGLTGPNAFWKAPIFSKDFWFGHDYVKGDGLVHKESYRPEGAGAPMVHTITYVQMDGRTIARAVSDQQARHATLPPSGTSRFDIRMNAPSPGQQWDA